MALTLPAPQIRGLRPESRRGTRRSDLPARNRQGFTSIQPASRNTMNKLLRSCAGVAAFAAAGFTQATTINFNELTPGAEITNQYAGVTFSSSPGNVNYAYAQGSSNNILCSGPIGVGVNCVEDTYIDFAAPVNTLTFWAIEPNFDGHDADFRIFQDGVYTTTEQLIGLGGLGNKFVDLSAYNHITRLEIVNILRDPSAENGIGWDDFTYTAAVPEPETLALMLAGLAGLAGVRIRARRRND